MHPQSKKIFDTYLKKSKELKLNITDCESRNNLLKKLVIEFSYPNEELGRLLLSEVQTLRVIYHIGRIDSLEDLQNSQDKLPVMPNFNLQ